MDPARLRFRACPRLFARGAVVLRPRGAVGTGGETAQEGGRLTSDQLCVPVEDFAQLAGWFDTVLLHHLEEAEDVTHAGQSHTLFARQVLNDLHLADVAL